jgi:hypothetical protein
MFKNILEYLYTVKISDVMPPLPEVVSAKKDMFDRYVDFFKLRMKPVPRLSQRK